MAEQESNGRIEELKARLAADPESRVFYQLGEELRKNGNPSEAEQVLRKGLETHPAYLSAWISLGRVLQDSNRPAEAVEVLNRAFEIDRQNVVVARLLGESYRAMGENVEAIKKYKLVAALHPADEAVHDIIREIETQLTSGSSVDASSQDAPLAPPPDAELAAEALWEPVTDADVTEDMVAGAEQEPLGEEPQGEELVTSPDSEASEAAMEQDTSEEQPGWQSSGETDRAEDVTAEDGRDQMWNDSAQPSWNEEDPVEDDGRAPEPSWTTAEASARPDVASADTGLDTGEDDVVATVTMGDLYARQGHVEQAREIYRRVLEREPENAEASGRLELLSDDDTDQQISSTRAKVVRLEQWLSKIRD